jgi:hypothetical protein
VCLCVKLCALRYEEAVLRAQLIREQQGVCVYVLFARAGVINVCGTRVDRAAEQSHKVFTKRNLAIGVLLVGLGTIVYSQIRKSD